MPTNYTEHYALSQWEPGDKVRMEDFNADNAKIDGALGAHAAALASLTEAVPKLGNCAVVTGTYTGTGEYQTAPLTFPGKPMFLMVRSSAAYGMLAIGGFSQAFSIEADMPTTFQMTWDDRSVSWRGGSSAAVGLNGKDRTYYYMALLAMDE